MEPARRDPEVDLIGLVENFQAGIWRYLRRLGCDPSTADDLCQETFLAVCDRPFEVRTTDATRGYLRRVAGNLFLKHRRAERRQARSIEAAEHTWNQLCAADDGEAYREALRACLGELRGRGREAIELSYGRRLPRKRVATALGMRDQGVKTLLARARSALRDCIRRRLAS